MTTTDNLYLDPHGYYAWPPAQITPIDHNDRFKVGDSVNYAAPDGTIRTLTVVSMCMVEGAIPTYYRLKAVDKSGWYQVEASERYFDLA